jgi:hypothetical protein
MADVQVTFGANIEKLVAGVDQIKSSIGGLAEAATSLAGVLAGAFSVDKLEKFVLGYGELGEQIERSAAMLGASTKETQEFGLMAKIAQADAPPPAAAGSA